MQKSAKIIKKFIIKADVTNSAPLRIGSGFDDGLTDILILKNKNGKIFIPGTSLAGVLRTEISSLYGDKTADIIFGSIEGDDANQSMINVSDIEFDESSIIYRNGVAIDYLTGVGKNGAKYDYEAAERGAKGTAQIEITVRAGNVPVDVEDYNYMHESFREDFAGDVAASVADVLTSGINVGSLTTKGFGKINSVEPAQCFGFDFAAEEAADLWLEYISTGKLPAKAVYTASTAEKPKAAGDFYMKIDCALQSSMIIGNSEPEDADENIAERQMKSKNDYVLPGTSIKGVLRNHAQKILHSLSGSRQIAEEFVENCMGCAGNNAKEGCKSRLYVDEVYVPQNKLYAMTHSRNRIDRFTGGTQDGSLFTVESVWQQEKGIPVFEFNLRLKNCCEEEAGLMLLLLKDLWNGNISFGGGKSIGRGVLMAVGCQIDYKNKSYTFNSAGSFSLKGDNGVASTGDIEELEGFVLALAGEMNG